MSDRDRIRKLEEENQQLREAKEERNRSQSRKWYYRNLIARGYSPEAASQEANNNPYAFGDSR